MPEEAAVLDAPLDTAAPPDDTTIDTSAENGGGSEGADTAETPAEGGGELPPAAAAGADTGLVIDGKRLSASAKATLEEIKAKDPRLAAQIKSALFSADALKRALPGGLKEVGELRQSIEELGGPEGIARIREEQAEWNALDQQFVSGDPRFVENIAASSPEAFLKLAPAVFQKFAELNSEGYSAYVSQVFVSDMQQEGIPLALERLQDFIGDNPRAMEVWKKLAGYVNRVAGLAAKPVNPPAKAQQQDDGRERSLAEREQALTRNDWRGAADAERLKSFSSEYARLTQGRKVTETQKAAIQELYVSRLGAALRKVQNFNSNIDRYFANKDREGYLRYISSIYKQEIPKALRSAVESVLPGKPGPAATRVAANTAQSGKATAAAAASGYAWTAAPPDKHTIDVNRTTMDMIREGRAVLIGGKKVQWKRP